MHLLCTANESDAIEQKEFANWLLKIGKGQISIINGLASNIIQLPNNIVLQLQNINNLIQLIYLNLSINSNRKYLIEQVILALKNVDVYFVNTIIIDQFPGKKIEYFSTDAIEEQSNSEYQYPIEF
ncbi:ATP-dependent DNA helicase pif1-like [Rhizophagus irregularis DAOM 181602=DAOM 197198]|uniref:Uncharacterized protein n=1 Tax=Rhizophagus irregularis (strain DAOM 197198w) TaxID=1432141 RepID=A0A015MNW2_RHIIW|nr:hypothetical protein RirG_104570 [Rhizophagus irregularis DAOM 197198w]GBC44283.1 ATP-dependent DNA helicase pif1-like [Rhizophagus irregularis DAOM 181602=DAOM 197198]